MIFVRPEEEFVNSARDVTRSGPERDGWGAVLVIAALIFGFIAWAAVFEIEEVTRGIGRVIPSTELQKVQSLEGGIIRAIQVSEGDVVEAGDVLLQIDDTSFLARQGELLQREAALLAEETRLDAEARQQPDVTFEAEFEAMHPIAVGAERAVFFARRAELDSELQTLQSLRRQRESELVELEAGLDKNRNVLGPLREEQELTASLVASRSAPRIELLRLNARLAELEGDLKVGEASRQTLAAGLDEIDSRVDQAITGYVTRARQRLALVQADLSVVQQSLRAATDRVARTVLRAPARGVVNRVTVSTLGAVVQPGADLVEIVPIDDRLLVEARIVPQDVAFITPGDRVNTKITAYDYLTYGALSGEVLRIGADTITDADGREFFEVIVQTDRAFLGDADKPLPITSGMVASIDIQTGRKTVLDYLLQPVRRVGAEALRER